MIPGHSGHFVTLGQRECHDQRLRWRRDSCAFRAVVTLLRAKYACAHTHARAHTHERLRLRVSQVSQPHEARIRRGSFRDTLVTLCRNRPQSVTCETVITFDGQSRCLEAVKGLLEGFGAPPLSRKASDPTRHRTTLAPEQTESRLRAV